jgi:hypothetical protein
MAVVMYHEPTAMTPEKYDAVIRALEEAGAGNPDGRLRHYAFELAEGRLAVIDIWESPEKFQEFGATIGPILEQQGVDGQPQFGRIHNSIQG